MPYPPFPSVYNPFLVTEPEYTAPQQTVYPEMTNKNEMQMFDEALMKNGLDRMNPDKSFYTDPTSIPQIMLREYNQPNALQQRLANIPNIVKNVEDARSNFATYGDMNKQGVLLPKDIPTPELDMLMGKAETPYTMDYTPFESEEEMLRNPKLILPDNTPYEAILNNEEEQLDVESGAGPEQYNAPEPINIPFNKFQGTIPNNIDVSNIAKNMPLPPSNNEMGRVNNASNAVKNWMGGLFDSNPPSDKTNPTNPIVETSKNKFGTPEAYYLGKSMLDATALINNMVQPQPPSIQMKNTYFERQRLNPEPYDTMRSQMRDQGTQAYRLQRENISQASDLMKGLAAVTSGTQQGLMQVGMQQAGAEQAVSNANQQISMQEQAGIAQTQNQETLTNYQNQSVAQQLKDQMVSAQLNRLGDTAGAYSDYVVKKGLAQKMTDLSKEQANKGNAIQLAMLKYQAGQNELNSDTFKEAQRQNVNQYISDTKTNLLADPRYSSLGPDYDPLTFNTRESSLKNLEQRINILGESYNGFTEEPQKPTRTTEMTDDQWKASEADYEKRKWRFDTDKERYTIAKKQYDLEKPKIDLERSFIGDLTKSYDIAGKRTDFQSDWFKKRGLKTIEEVLTEVETLMNPNRQIFK